MTKRFAVRAIIAAALVLQVQLSFVCSWAIGYFNQVTNLRGTVVGMNRGWPRWVRQHVNRENVKLRLYEYRWPLHSPREMPLVKTETTDGDGRFDFGELKEGHYTLIVDWPSEDANWFDVEITKPIKPTSAVKIDVPRCTPTALAVTNLL